MPNFRASWWPRFSTDDLGLFRSFIALKDDNEDAGVGCEELSRLWLVHIREACACLYIHGWLSGFDLVSWYLALDNSLHV